jgi:DNA polymerase-3 subunit epsilon
MPPVELPPRYYLTHFQDFLGAVAHACDPLLEPEHREFVRRFGLLSEEARCLYVRMVNRKGEYFRKDELVYPEVADAPAAQAELLASGFARTLAPQDWPRLYPALPKERLVRFLLELGLKVPRSAPKAKVLELAQLHLDAPPTGLAAEYLVQLEGELVDYFLFLYFGERRGNLLLYTLRDLGLRRINAHPEHFKSRFETLAEAKSNYFYHQLKALSPEAFPPLNTWPQVQTPQVQELREELLFKLAETKLPEAPDEALRILELCHQHPAREKRARLLYQQGLADECQALLRQLLQAPASEEEFLFAEDFLERKFCERRRGQLTELLRSAREVWIDEGYFRHPELGVIQELRTQGYESWFTENELWNVLFGLVFWQEIFDEPETNFHNPFELIPAMLFDGRFFVLHQERIEARLAGLGTGEELWRTLEARMQEKELQQVGPFRWSAESAEALGAFLKGVSCEGLVTVLRAMARDYARRSTGFPDLLAVRDGKVKFFEVKAEGDSLRSHQLTQIQLLQEAGIDVELLQVRYRVNPAQLYVVVDLETTGVRPGLHRITEIGAVKVQAGKIIDRFQTLINPGRPIPRFIQQLTGISNEMVQSAPAFSEVAERFSDFTRDCIFVAHNVGFDYRFIQAEYQRLEQRFVRPFICTRAGMKKFYPKLESYGLANLCQHFGVELTRHHRALSDAEAAAGLLQLINQQRARLQGDR